MIFALRMTVWPTLGRWASNSQLFSLWKTVRQWGGDVLQFVCWSGETAFVCLLFTLGKVTWVPFCLLPVIETVFIGVQAERMCGMF